MATIVFSEGHLYQNAGWSTITYKVHNEYIHPWCNTRWTNDWWYFHNFLWKSSSEMPTDDVFIFVSVKVAAAAV